MSIRALTELSVADLWREVKDNGEELVLVKEWRGAFSGRKRRSEAEPGCVLLADEGSVEAQASAARSTAGCG
jgi:hypothetical protein